MPSVDVTGCVVTKKPVRGVVVLFWAFVVLALGALTGWSLATTGDLRVLLLLLLEPAAIVFLMRSVYSEESREVSMQVVYELENLTVHLVDAVFTRGVYADIIYRCGGMGSGKMRVDSSGLLHIEAPSVLMETVRNVEVYSRYEEAPGVVDVQLTDDSRAPMARFLNELERKS